MYRNCSVGRKLGFEFNHVPMCIAYTLPDRQLTFLKNRLSNHLSEDLHNTQQDIQLESQPLSLFSNRSN